MSLALYTEPLSTKIVFLTSPFTITFDGQQGGAQDKRVYIRNDDTTKWYTDIQLIAVDTNGLPTSITNNNKEGWHWKLAQKDIPLTTEEWDEITPGNTLSIAEDIGSAILSDIVTYLPVWVRITIPRSQKLQTLTQVVLRLTATETLL